MWETIAVAVVLRLISKYTLDYPSALADITDDKLREQYNGVGSERWSEDKRKALSEAFKPYEVCVVIHDVCQARGIPAYIADDMLWHNLLKVWAKDFGIFRWFKRKAWIERIKVLPKLYKILTENRDA